MLSYDTDLIAICFSILILVLLSQIDFQNCHTSLIYRRKYLVIIQFRHNHRWWKYDTFL